MISYLFELEDPAAEMMLAMMIGAAAKLVGLALIGRRQRRRFEQIGQVSSLHIHPIKSCGAIDETSADCTPVGLDTNGLTDRHWMILDETDKVIALMQEPSLTLIRCESVGEAIRLTAPNMPALDLPKKPDLRNSRSYTLSKQPIPIVDCGKDAQNWITKYLGRSARMVFSCPELGVRNAYNMPRKWDNTAREGDVTVFAYLTSYLMTTTASLQEINSKLTTPVSIKNFRPNIVIDTNIPFDEDNWKEIRIGDHTLFHVVEPCRRCMMTTIDPDSGDKNQEQQPLKLLKSFRCREPYGSAPLFGIYVANDIPGHVKVGDPVYVIKNYGSDMS